MSLIVLSHKDFHVPIEVIEKRVIVSPHSGRELRELEGEASASDRGNHDRFLALIEATNGEFWTASDRQKQDLGRWFLRCPSHSIINNAEFRYQVVMSEWENRVAERLVLGDLDLVPERYRETADPHVLIRTIVPVSQEQEKQLRALIDAGEYVGVRRVGVSEDVIEARFGLVLWSSHESGHRYLLTIVSREEDDSQPPGVRIGVLDLLDSAAREHTAFMGGLVRHLLRELKRRELLDEAAIDRIHDAARAEIADRKLAFAEVRDVGQFFSD